RLRPPAQLLRLPGRRRYAASGAAHGGGARVQPHVSAQPLPRQHHAVRQTSQGVCRHGAWRQRVSVRPPAPAGRWHWRAAAGVQAARGILGAGARRYEGARRVPRVRRRPRPGVVRRRHVAAARRAAAQPRPAGRPGSLCHPASARRPGHQSQGRTLPVAAPRAAAPHADQLAYPSARVGRPPAGLRGAGHRRRAAPACRRVPRPRDRRLVGRLRQNAPVGCALERLAVRRRPGALARSHGHRRRRQNHHHPSALPLLIHADTARQRCTWRLDHAPGLRRHIPHIGRRQLPADGRFPAHRAASVGQPPACRR
ncbi:hypothetical protein LPJ73_009317, partial [Coemansia sp. RSA 2703]